METKIVYNFDPNTGVFIGPQECYKTSIDEDTWQWTGEAMELPPPQTAENEIAVANADRTDWEIKPYFVGTVYWFADGSKHIITEIGELLPEGALLEDPNSDQILINQFKTEIQKHLDIFAQERGYDNCLSCCTYADSAIAKFAAEGQYMKNKRDQYWSIGYQIIDDVQSGSREVPSLEQLFIELGPLDWPN